MDHRGWPLHQDWALQGLYSSVSGTLPPLEQKPECGAPAEVPGTLHRLSSPIPTVIPILQDWCFHILPQPEGVHVTLPRSDGSWAARQGRDPGTPDLKTEVFYPHAIIYKGQQENGVGWAHQRNEGQGARAGEIYKVGDESLGAWATFTHICTHMHTYTPNLSRALQ